MEEPTEIEISVKFEKGMEKVDDGDDWDSGKMSRVGDYPSLFFTSNHPYSSSQ